MNDARQDDIVTGALTNSASHDAKEKHVFHYVRGVVARSVQRMDRQITATRSVRSGGSAGPSRRRRRAFALIAALLLATGADLCVNVHTTHAASYAYIVDSQSRPGASCVNNPYYDDTLTVNAPYAANADTEDSDTQWVTWQAVLYRADAPGGQYSQESAAFDSWYQVGNSYARLGPGITFSGLQPGDYKVRIRIVRYWPTYGQSYWGESFVVANYDIHASTPTLTSDVGITIGGLPEDLIYSDCHLTV